VAIIPLTHKASFSYTPSTKKEVLVNNLLVLVASTETGCDLRGSRFQMGDEFISCNFGTEDTGDGNLLTHRG
jgi:hypothetical protein